MPRRPRPAARFSIARPLIEALDPRRLMSGGQATAVGYLPDYRVDAGLLNALKTTNFEGLTQVNYFSVVPTSAGLLPGTTVNGASNTSTTTTGNISLTGSNSQLSQIVTAAHAAGVKVNIVVGGAGTNPGLTSVIQGGSAKWQTFAASAAQFAASHGIDGVDIDWEPSGLTSTDVANYGGMLSALRAANPNLILSAAVNAEKLQVSSGGSSYVLNATAMQSLSQVNIMAYDLEAGNTSPEVHARNDLNAWGTYATGLGIPKTKLIYGMPFYGTSGTTWANTQSDTYADLVNANGHLADPSANSVTIGSTTWNYNGPALIGTKAAYALANGFGGMLAWELGQDYRPGGAYDNTYSLLPRFSQALAAGTGTIHGTITSAGGSGLGGVTVYLDLNNSGTLDAGDLSTVTANTGTYAFSDLLIGSYAVRQVVPGGYKQTSPAAGTATSVTVAGGQTATADFADTQATVSVIARLNGDLPALVGDQRSMVDDMVYTFSEPVTAGAGAFSIAVSAGQTGTVPTLAWAAVNPANDGSSTQWVVTFSGNGVESGSIGDGVYDLSMNALAFTAASGDVVQARSPDTFWRLFADDNGDASVTIADFNALAQSFNLSQGQAGYDAAMDSNADNRITIADFNALASRFNQRIYNGVVQPSAVAMPALGSGSVSGVVYKDNDADHAFDAGDRRQAGVVVFIDANNNGRLDADERQTTTDAQGRYTFRNLTAGTYRVRAVRQTTPPATIKLTTRQAKTNVLLGVSKR